MTPEQFVIWLKGFAKAAHTYNLTPEQWDSIKDELDKVSDEEVHIPQQQGHWPQFWSGTAPDIKLYSSGTSVSSSVGVNTISNNTVTNFPPGTSITYTTKQQLND